ncbi:MAG: tetratricopeptide repeat protein [Candidatus Muirbacterium halophilum]|nr:tetratricopeptide repeat protein [Candidatus Muirbacterium halophilum]MCK9474790.1 tetratricopeptide repeat protein [Candidatus Muirbacterium halophilum]
MRKLSVLIILILVTGVVSCGRKTPQKTNEPVKISNSAEKIELAFQFEDNGEFDKAIKIYRELVISDPYNVDAVEKLYLANRKEGDRYFSEGEFKKSIIHLEVAYKYFKEEELGNKLRDSLLFIAENEKEIDRRIPYLEKIIALFPNNPKALKMMAIIFENSNSEKAVEIYEKLLSINPDDDNIRIKLSKLYVVTGKEDEGNRLLEDVKDIESVYLSEKDIKFYKSKVRELIDSGDSKNAIKIIRMLLESEKDSVQRKNLLSDLAQAYFNQRSYGNVLHIFDEYNEFDIENEENRFIVLLSMIEMGKSELFINNHSKFLNSGLQFQVNRDDYLWFRYYSSVNNELEMNKVIEKIKERNENDFLIKIYSELSDNASDKKEFEKAIYYIDLSNNIKDEAENHFRKGIYLDKMRKYSQALSEYSKSVVMDSENPKYRYYRILSLKRNTKYDEMEEEKNFVIDKFRGSKWANYVKKIFGESDLAGNIKMFSDVDSYYNYGLDFARNGDFDKALYNLKMASRLQPENYNILINIANVYFATGAYSEALVYYINAANFAENNSYVDFFLAKCLSEKGLYKEAYEKAKDSYTMDMENKEAMELVNDLGDKKERELIDNRFYAYKDIGIAAYNEEMYDISYLYFKKSLDIKKDDYFVLSSISNLLIKKELFDEAWKYIERISILFPNEFEANKLNFEYKFRKNREEGKIIFKEMLRDFPNEKWLYDNLKKVFENLTPEVKNILNANLLIVEEEDLKNIIYNNMEDF